MVELCGENKQCQYDYRVTGNENIAKGTMKFIEKFKEIESDVQKGNYYKHFSKFILCDSVQKMK